MNFKNQLEDLSNKNIFLILLSFFLLVRFTNLTILPIFNDESTYLDWGWRMWNMEGEVFHSVMHAKTPLLMWIFGLAQKFFDDPLTAGRSVSVLLGLATALGLYFISERHFGRKVAILSFLLYLFSPLFSFYDRQALMEAAVGAVGVWAFYFYIKTESTLDHKYAAILGTILGFGYLIKSNAFAFVLITSALLVYKFLKIDRQERRDLLISASVLFIIAFIVVSPLVFNSTFWSSLGQNEKYILTPRELIRFPVVQWIKNFKSTVEISLIYLNPVIVLGSVYSGYLFFKQENFDRKLMILWVALGMIITNLLATGITTRYITSFLPLLLVLGSYSIVRLFEKNKLYAAVAFFLLIPSVLLSIIQMLNPIRYFEYLEYVSPRYSEKQVYVNNWTSGYGVHEVIDYLKQRSVGQRVVVGVRLDAGNPENAVLAYFYDSNNVVPTYLDAQMFSGDLSQIDCLETSVPLYFISRDGNLGSLDKYFLEVTRFNKPEGKNYVGVHRLDEDCQGETVRLF